MIMILSAEHCDLETLYTVGLVVSIITADAFPKLRNKLSMQLNG